MKQESRMFIAIALCAVIYFVWMAIFPPAPQPKKTALQNPNTVQKPTTDATITSNENTDSSTASATNVAKEMSASETKASAQEIVFETNKSDIVINTKGAKIVSFKLKDYNITADKTSPKKNLLTETPQSSALFLGIKEYPYLSEQKIYEVVESTDSTVTLAWQDDKIAIKKIFTVLSETSDYAVKVRYEIQNLSSQNLMLTPYWQTQVSQKDIEEPSGFLSFFSGGAAQSEKYAPLYYHDEGVNTYTEWKEFETVKSSALWAGIADRYFLMAITSYPLKTVALETQYLKNENRLVQNLFAGTKTLSPNQVIGSEVLTYIGPKKTSELKLVNAGFEEAIDYGWFGVLAQPILWLMQAIYSIIPSWGLAIILLTFIVKLALYPINKKSMSSMKAMQQLQPKLKKIREQYADDKQRQNQEVMQLFRTHKVNPLGGCLPMLLQLPIYFALYRVLWNAIELYHTPFLHYKDLSAPDPYFIAPILMGIFMVLQQKLTPNPSTDPSQKKMMMIMPVFFTFIMLFLPVGLVIYICVNTIMTVIQQYMMHKDISLRDVMRGRFKGTPAA